jgi:hypothetical protein
MSIIDFGLSLAGVPQEEIADLDKSLPALGRIVAAAKEAEPFLTQAKPHVDALMPLMAQAMPHINALMPIVAKLYPIGQKAYPDIVAVTPTVQELVAFANARQNPA